jgi:hypothetical protein
VATCAVLLLATASGHSSVDVVIEIGAAAKGAAAAAAPLVEDQVAEALQRVRPCTTQGNRRHGSSTPDARVMASVAVTEAGRRLAVACSVGDGTGTGLGQAAQITIASAPGDADWDAVREFGAKCAAAIATRLPTCPVADVSEQRRQQQQAAERARTARAAGRVAALAAAIK